MSLFSKFKEDPLLAQVVRSSGKLFSANTVSLGLSVLQGVMAARLLQPEGLGLMRVAMAYASTVNSLLSFRMNELVVRYGGEYLARGEKDKAAALMKAAGLAEGFVSLLAFLSVLATAGLAEKYLTESQGAAWMFVVYAVGLLANFNVETAAGVLQVARKIELQGVFNLTQNILATLIIGAAFFWKGSLPAVLGAYLLGKVVWGLAMFAAAQIQLNRALCADWRQVPLSRLTAVRDLIRFAFSSNVSATVIKIFRESELLWVAFFLPTGVVGLYSVAYTLVSFIAIPTDPLISAAFPEINRLAVQKAWARLRDFLRKITALSFAVNLALGIGFVFFGRWAILLYAGAEFLDAYPALVALAIGLIFNYTLFWNRPLLLALGLPEFPIWATLAAGLVKLGLAFWLIPTYGIAAAGALLSYYYIASVWIIVLRGVKQIRIEAEG